MILSWEYTRFVLGEVTKTFEGMRMMRKKAVCELFLTEVRNIHQGILQVDKFRFFFSFDCFG